MIVMFCYQTNNINKLVISVPAKCESGTGITEKCIQIRPFGDLI